MRKVWRVIVYYVNGIRKTMLVCVMIPIISMSLVVHPVKASPIWTMTTYYGEVDEVHATPHRGVDYAMPKGTPLESIVDGKVSDVKHAGARSWGTSVHIKDSNGREIIYGHLDDAIVKIGDTVHKHDIIAHSGNTGRSTGPHLHLEIRINGKSIDPMQDINSSGIVKQQLARRGA
jgi:murein DD-endopeptidase MepM/ murein hydrolase activator NlpD